MMKRKQDGIKQSSDIKKTKQSSSYFSDTRLVPRIRQYINACGRKKTINIATMTEDLQRQYGEYSRKKKNAFIKSVERAYEFIMSEDRNSKDIDQLEDDYLKKKIKPTSGDSDSDREQPVDEDKSYSSDNNYVEYEDSNSMNNLMSNLYRNSPARPSSTAVKDETKGDKSVPTLLANPHQDDDLNMLDDISGVSSVRGDNSTSLQQQNDLYFIDKHGENSNQDFTKSSNSVVADDAESVSSKNNKGKKVVKKRKVKEKSERTQKGPDIQTSSVKFADFGGNEKCLVEVCKLLVHMRHPEVYQQLGITPPRGFLLHGPPGCGKTLLAHAIAGELELPFIKLAATEIVTGVSGESEEIIRNLFDKAVTTSPCILFIDEIDAITPKRETASKDMERRIVAQLLSCMDDLNNKMNIQVLVIGATNRPDSIDPALRRAGRFDREIPLGIPDKSARSRILQVLCRNLRLGDDFDFDNIARNTPGFVGADLMALTREAAMTAVNRVFNDLQVKIQNSECDKDTLSKGDEPFSDIKRGDNHISDPFVKGDSCSCDSTLTEGISSSELIDGKAKENLQQIPERSSKKYEIQENTELSSALNWLKDQPPLDEHQLKQLHISSDDFQEALKHVQPSAKREGFATIPDVTWDDIGALHQVREELQIAIMAPIRYPEKFQDLGLTKAQGILLTGPPGCGKTLLAKAISNESGINFISVKGPELLNMYVGESERAVRQVFQRARNSSPCVIFFDELDSLCPRRTEGGEGGASVRVVNQLLTEMDGLEERKQVFIIGATNRPDIIDPAILRPGRLDKTLYVGLPSAGDRLDILQTITKKGTRPKLACDVVLDEVANDNRCLGFTGADLAALVREASVCALRSIISCTTSADPEPSLEVNKAHFETAFTKVKPSVSVKDHQKYEKIKDQMTT